MSIESSDDDWAVASSILYDASVSGVDPCDVNYKQKKNNSVENLMNYDSTNKKILVLLDMNGTLLLRSDKRVMARKNNKPIDFLFRQRSGKKQYYYLRDGAVELISWLMYQRSLGTLDAAFYTSMRMENAVPVAAHLCAPSLAKFGGSPLHIYGQYIHRDEKNYHA